MLGLAIRDDVGVSIELVVGLFPERSVALVRRDPVLAVATEVNDRIVVDRITHGVPRTVGSLAPVMMDDIDAVAKVCRYFDEVTIDFYIASILNEDLWSPKPVVVTISIGCFNVVTNYRVE